MILFFCAKLKGFIRAHCGKMVCNVRGKDKEICFESQPGVSVAQLPALFHRTAGLLHGQPDPGGGHGLARLRPDEQQDDAGDHPSAFPGAGSHIESAGGDTDEPLRQAQASHDGPGPFFPARSHPRHTYPDGSHNARSASRYGGLHGHTDLDRDADQAQPHLFHGEGAVAPGQRHRPELHDLQPGQACGSGHRRLRHQPHQGQLGERPFPGDPSQRRSFPHR